MYEEESIFVCIGNGAFGRGFDDGLRRKKAESQAASAVETASSAVESAASAASSAGESAASSAAESAASEGAKAIADFKAADFKATDELQAQADAAAQMLADKHEKLSLADGVYEVNVTLAGGSGRAKIASPTELTVKDGRATAKIVWSSDKYDYMEVDGIVLRRISKTAIRSL